jgi:UDP-N-acetylmuramoylalanine--D-glutamate ligase
VTVDFLHKKHKVLVVGLGFRTGLSAANFLAAEEHDVHVSDTKSHAELSDLVSQLDSSITVHAANQDISLLSNNFDCVILSPGVPAAIPLVKEAMKRGVPVISEIELASMYVKGISIGITGTDGKSTTTALTHHILKGLGFDSRMGGNIGIPLISMAGETTDASVTVIELSSYQLETVDTFKPDAAAFLNLTPDHLDRYDSLDSYFNAKMNIARKQTAEDYFIYNCDDERVARGADGVLSRTRGFSLTKESDAYCRDSIVYIKVGGSYKHALHTNSLSIMGLHNVQNVMTALLLVQAVYEKKGMPFPLAEAAVQAQSFKGLPHRMERLGEFKGRLFINDSKATTVGAVEMAIKSLDRPAVFIVGGRAKGDDYSRLARAMQGKVGGVVLIGETKKDFLKIFSACIKIEADDMDDAVKKGFAMTKTGDALILSPACASFDMYKSFEHRGDVFRDSVERLKSGAI